VGTSHPHPHPHPHPHLANPNAHTGTPSCTEAHPNQPLSGAGPRAPHLASRRHVALPPTPCSCFLRGSHVRFMVLPDILKNAPFFKKIDTKASKARSGTGKAKAAAKERTVGARPKTQIAPGPAPPPPPQPSCRRPPPTRDMCARTRAQSAAALDALAFWPLAWPFQPCGARLAWSSRVTPSPTAVRRSAHARPPA
jgi:hypothetical protein